MIVLIYYVPCLYCKELAYPKFSSFVIPVYSGVTVIPPEYHVDGDLWRDRFGKAMN